MLPTANDTIWLYACLRSCSSECKHAYTNADRLHPGVYGDCLHPGVYLCMCMHACVRVYLCTAVLCNSFVQAAVCNM